MASSSTIDINDIAPQRYTVCYQALSMGSPTGPVLKGVEVVFYAGETEVARRLEDLNTVEIESTVDGTPYTGFVVVDCPLEVNDYENITLCSPDDGSLVFARVTYDPTGVPSTSYFNLDGSAYTGTAPVRCNVDYETVGPFTVCATDTTVPATPVYTEYTRIDVYSGDVTDPANFETSVWQDISGAVVAAPVPSATLTLNAGSCTLQTGIVSSSNVSTGVVEVSGGTWNSNTVTGLKSVSVVAVTSSNPAAGNITITADTGSIVLGRPERGLALSWSIDGKEDQDELNTGIVVTAGANATAIVNYTYQ